MPEGEGSAFLFFGSTLDVGCSHFVLGISCLNQGVWRGGKCGGWVDQREVPPPRENRKNYFQSYLS
jgi:hypothetical protein